MAAGALDCASSPSATRLNSLVTPRRHLRPRRRSWADGSGTDERDSPLRDRRAPTGVRPIPKGSWRILLGVVVLSVGCCERQTVSEEASPDGKFVVADVLQNCGATAPLVTEVVLASADAPVIAGEENTVFRYRGGSPPRMRWITSQELLIETDKPLDAAKRLERWGEVQIRYGGSAAAGLPRP